MVRPHMKWVVLSLGLLATPALAQVLGTSFFLDDAILGPAGGAQTFPDVAWTGSGFFSVFADTRDGRRADLWFREFDAQGTPVGLVARPLLRAAAAQTQPALAASPTELLVAWLDDATCASEVKAQRFSFQGVPQGPALGLSTGACTSERPTVAFDPTSGTWLVAWGAHGAGREVHGAIVDTTGVRVSDFVIASGPGDARAPWATASSSGGFLLAWRDDRQTLGTSNIYVTSVSSTGAVTAPVQTAASGVTQLAPCLAAGGPGPALVAWVEGSTVRAQPVSLVGTPLGPPLDVATGPINDVACAHGPAGEVIIAVTDARATSRGVYLRTLATDAGVSAEFPAAPGSGYQSRQQPRLGVGNGLALLLLGGEWDYVTEGEVMGRALQLEPDRTVDAGALVVVGTGTVRHRRASAAFDGARYLAVWREDGRNSAGSDAFAVFVEPGSSRVEPDAGLRLTTSSANLASYPSVAASPTGGFFVSSGDETSGGLLRGRTVSRAGVVGAPIRLNDVTNFVDIHATAWFDDTWATASVRSDLVRLRRTTPAGATALGETPLQGTDGAPAAVEVASLGRTLLAVYPVRDAGLDVRGFRYESDAGLLDPVGLLIAGGAGDQHEPTVSAGRSLFLAAWTADGGVFATRVDLRGTVLDVPPLSLGATTGAATPAVGWTGRSFLVAWAQGEDLWAARVAEDGQRLDATPMIIASNLEVERAPRVTGGPSPEALLTWEVFDETLGGFRIAGRFFTEPDLIDAGTPDAGELDAGMPDAGDLDAGTPDGGIDDAGVPDAGQESGDGGLEVDGGAPPRGPKHYLVGCSQSGGELILVLVAAWLRKRAP